MCGLDAIEHFLNDSTSTLKNQEEKPITLYQPNKNPGLYKLPADFILQPGRLEIWNGLTEHFGLALRPIVVDLQF